MRSNYKKLGEYIRPVDERNSDLAITNLQGVSITKEFVPSIANIIGTDLSTYKIVRTGQFAYGPVTSRNGDKVSIALLKGEDCIISSSYSPFEVYKPDELLPEYLMLWFMRPEFDRYARFMSNGSAREVFDWDCMCGVELPVPPLPEQQKIVRDYQVITDRIELLRKMNDNLTACCGVNYQVMLDGFTEESDKDDLPEGWTIGSIGSYCDLKSGYAFKSEWWTDNGFKVIKIANIVDNAIDLDSCDSVIDEHAKLAKLSYSVPGDIFIAMTGATTGKIGILPFCKDRVVVNQRVGKFFLGKEPIKKAPFLFATLLSPRVVRRLQPDGMAGSAQDNLSADDIKNVAIVVPDTSTIEEFNTHNQSIIESIMTNDAELRLLHKLLDLLLSKIAVQIGA